MVLEEFREPRRAHIFTLLSTRSMGFHMPETVENASDTTHHHTEPTIATCGQILTDRGLQRKFDRGRQKRHRLFPYSERRRAGKQALGWRLELTLETEYFPDRFCIEPIQRTRAPITSLLLVTPIEDSSLRRRELRPIGGSLTSSFWNEPDLMAAHRVSFTSLGIFPAISARMSGVTCTRE